MPIKVRRAPYYYVTVQDQPGEAYRLLSALNTAGVDLLAFSVVPTGPTHTQLMVFPEDADLLVQAMKPSGKALTGPQQALLVQGDDDPGALIEIHEELFHASINVYAGTAVSSGRGTFGYVLYVRPEQLEKAAQVIGAD